MSEHKKIFHKKMTHLRKGDAQEQDDSFQKQLRGLLAVPKTEIDEAEAREREEKKRARKAKTKKPVRKAKRGPGK